MQDEYVIVKYLRLSLEDGDSPESDSIKNQRSLLDAHITHVFRDMKIKVIELIDDGYSGTNVNRPAFKKLLVLAETHGIHCVIVKDFSRFSRDYIEVGRYSDLLFPEWKIRFIAVNNGYDSKDYAGITCGIDLALQNLSYAMYSQDLSEKIKSVRKLQYKRGEYISAYAIYGYRKDPENIKHLIVDPEAAGIVKRIFRMSSEGIANVQIAKMLNSEGIPSPSEYKHQKGITKRKWTTLADTVYWTDSTVSKILKDERYTGKMVSGKTENPYVGSSKLIRIARENQVVVENQHEAIVTQELFDSVQKKPLNHPKGQRQKLLFSGLLRCGGCGRMLAYSGTNDLRRRYYCGYTKMTGCTECLQERITQQEITDVICEAVHMELLHTADILKTQEQFEKNLKIHERKIQNLYTKINELKYKKVDAYIRLTKRLISGTEFQAIQNNIKKQISGYEEEILGYREQGLSAEEWCMLDLFEKYIGVTELSNEMLTDLMKGIYIYNGKRIKIVWKFEERV